MLNWAKKFVAAWKRERQAKEERRLYAEKLLPAVKISGPVVVGPVQVVLVSDQKKAPTKAQLVAAFGEAGAAFWDSLAPSTYEYLTVVPVKTQRATG